MFSLLSARFYSILHDLSTHLLSGTVQRMLWYGGFLTYRKYLNARFLDIDGTFARDFDYL